MNKETVKKYTTNMLESGEGRAHVYYWLWLGPSLMYHDVTKMNTETVYEAKFMKYRISIEVFTAQSKIEPSGYTDTTLTGGYLFNTEDTVNYVKNQIMSVFR